MAGVIRWAKETIATTAVKAVVGFLAVSLVVWLFRQPLRAFLARRFLIEGAYWEAAGAALVVVLAMVLTWTVGRRRLRPRRPRWARYTADEIDGLKWTWRWPQFFAALERANTGDVRKIAESLTPVCPRCGGVLYNPTLDPALDHIGWEQRTDLPYVKENELKCLTCDFEKTLTVTYRALALTIAGEVVRRARRQFRAA